MAEDGTIPLPPHAYIPGQNARHPEDWFDEIKSSVHPGTILAGMHHTAAFRAGLKYLERGYFWECHEVLEAVWLQTPEGSAERNMVQALIQLANARLKLLMQRPKAAKRLVAMVGEHLARIPSDQVILGLTVAGVRGWLNACEAAISCK
ncbi:DUF309 domain containing protein [Sulfitobacter noctilucae]|uniref:DUF309 domain-containing protein n=1 Tax=Sulfitobacter noctilucae TaxID=1342302 RepID=UPI000567FF96|nr:DUF309 domain-containing protein [Sulfitobacter noctilucae]KIN65342.1 DUF309 domain containing protein [Sulfitobacter noctilucae]